MGCCDNQGGPLSTGLKRYILLSVLFLTWVFWNVAIFHCTFLRIFLGSNNYKNGIDTGIFRAGAYDDDLDRYACRAYHPDESVKSAIKSSRAFGVLGFMFHTLAFVIVLALELCVTWRKELLWTMVRGLIVASMVCSVLIFTMFASEGCTDEGFDLFHCAPGPGGIIAVFNIFILIGAIALSWLTDAPNRPFCFVRRWTEQDSGSSDERLPKKVKDDKARAPPEGPQDDAVYPPPPEMEDMTTNTFTEAAIDVGNHDEQNVAEGTVLSL